MILTTIAPSHCWALSPAWSSQLFAFSSLALLMLVIFSASTSLDSEPSTMFSIPSCISQTIFSRLWMRERLISQFSLTSKRPLILWIMKFSSQSLNITESEELNFSGSEITSKTGHSMWIWACEVKLWILAYWSANVASPKAAALGHFYFYFS